MPSTPLFRFGHGPSYTTFEYGPLNAATCGRPSPSPSGPRRRTEVVQLYAADTATGVTLPAQQLVGFARVDLEPGASQSVSFTLPPSVLAYTGPSGDVVVEPEPVELSAGSSSTDVRSTATLTVTGEARSVEGEDRAFFSVATVGPR